MDDVLKMFRLLVNGQSTMKSDLLTAIQKLDKKIDGVEERLDKKIDGVEDRLTKRIDKIGLQIANLEDDTPTRNEFDNLESKVDKFGQILRTI
jgi:hypothetical protein